MAAAVIGSDWASIGRQLTNRAQGFITSVWLVDVAKDAASNEKPMFLKTLLVLPILLGNGGHLGAAPAAGHATPDVEKLGVRRSALVAAAATLDAQQVVARVQKFYKKTQRLTAKFKQSYTNKTFGITKDSVGTLRIKRPGKMRWDYKGKKLKVEKSFISDGKMLWAVEHNNRQYFKKNIKDDMLPVAVTFLYGKGDLSRDFAASLDTSGVYGEKHDFVLKLDPRKPSAQYKTLYLVVDTGNYRVKQSIVIEASGNTNHFRFYEPDTDKAIEDSDFVVSKKTTSEYRFANPDAKEKKAQK